MRHDPPSTQVVALLVCAAFLGTFGCGSRSGSAEDSGTADASVLDAEITTDGSTPPPDDAEVEDDGLHPVLSNFRVEDAHRDRVYFDSSEPITATTAAGFIVSGRTVSGVHVEADATTGHYLTVDIDFTFYDNTTVRYEGGSDLQDLQGNGLYEFTLRYVENLIPEPSASTSRFVTATALGGGDGTSEGTAWTMAEAGTNAQPGQTVWIKAGDYGNAPLVVNQGGTATAPIKYIGYQTTPGDSPGLPRDQYTVFDANMMPYIHTSSTSGTGVNFAGKQFIIVKNIQIEGYYSSLDASGSVEDCLIENVYAKGPSYYGLYLFGRYTQRVRVKACYVSNAGGAGIRVAGHRNLIDDAYVCSLGTPNMDYYISLYGGEDGDGRGNIVRNSAVVRDPADTHTGHGISVKAGAAPDGQAGATPSPSIWLEHTLIENCTLHELGQGIELRHSHTRYTVARNVVATGGEDGNLVTFRDDTSFNIVENCVADGVYLGVKFTDNLDEDTVGTPQAGGHDNKVINTLFNNCGRSVGVGTIAYGGETPVESTDNEFLNCTFYGSTVMFSLPFAFGDSNQFTNCNIVGVGTEYYTTQPTRSYTYCNFWDSWGVLPGTGNVSMDPQFVDAPNGDLQLQNSSPIRDLGTDLADVHYDMNGVERPSGEYSIGAYE